jgi:hypothetical protein
MERHGQQVDIAVRLEAADDRRSIQVDPEDVGRRNPIVQDLQSRCDLLLEGPVHPVIVGTQA